VNGVYIDPDTKLYWWEITTEADGYVPGGTRLFKTGFKTEWEAAQDFIVQGLDHIEGLAGELTGCTWKQILKGMRIDMPRRR